MSEEINEEQIRKDPLIRRELQNCAVKASGTAEPGEDVPSIEWGPIWFYATLFAAAGVFYYLLGLETFPIRGKYLPLLQRLSASLMLTLLVLTVALLLRTLLLARVDSPVTRYNLRRVINLAATLLILLLAFSTLFVNWYTAAVSLGVASLVLGLALQNPLTSFFAWVYILIRRPYKVGDRIRIGDVAGDVIELGYLDTTLWEFSGDHVSGNHPSGRIIRFANSRVFSEYVINYSWPLFPYIWNEIRLFVSYESDLVWVKETLLQVVDERIGPEMRQRVDLYRSILAETPVDEVVVRGGGSVSFSAHENTWLQVTVRYLVEPKQSGAVKNLLFPRLLEALQREPGRVMFPKTNMR